jgi:hypothetical protein
LTGFRVLGYRAFCYDVWMTIYREKTEHSKGLDDAAFAVDHSADSA